jgi:putative transposase
LAISIEPSVRISDLVKDLKGGSAHDVNNVARDKLLHWQRGYGVVSFGMNNLDWVREYIRSQKEHHANDRIIGRLEQITIDEDPSE